MKSSKGIIYILFFLLFITYLVSANYIFTALFKVDNESSREFVHLPEKAVTPEITSNIRMYIDTIEKRKIKWKDLISIKGWAFKLNPKNEEIRRYLVLYSEKIHYIFSLDNLIVKRKDVAEAFKVNNEFTGFNALIANDYIKEGNYRLGIIIEDAGDKHFYLSDQYLTKHNDNVSISGFISTKMNINIEDIGESGRSVKHFFDLIEEQNGNINFKGWGFLEGLDTTNIKHYVLFKKGNEINAFDTANKNTKDITEYFEDYGLDLDNARFEAEVPKDLLGKGKYQLGLYIEVGYEKGIVFVERFVEID